MHLNRFVCIKTIVSISQSSGPSFAREIVEGVATAVVIASEDLDLARDLAALFSDKNFKCYTSQDVIGVEIGGAVKNVIALGAGMCEGLGLGTNAMSGLVTRGCNEMRRLGVTFGARPSTIAGLSGTFRIWTIFLLVGGSLSLARLVITTEIVSGMLIYSHSIICLVTTSCRRRRRHIRDMLWTPI